MERFERVFLAKLAEFSKENGYVITDDGHIEKITDWVDPARPFHYEAEVDEQGLKIAGIEQD